jgi:hypothetical protein
MDAVAAAELAAHLPVQVAFWGLYAGKGDDHEEASEKLLVMMQELSDWFQDNIGGQYGGITCEAVVGQDGPGRIPPKMWNHGRGNVRQDHRNPAVQWI